MLPAPVKATGFYLIMVCFSTLIWFWPSDLLQAAPVQRDYWPTQKWRTAWPEAKGMDTQKLLLSIPFIINNLPEIQSLLVVKNGYLVFENYYKMGSPDRQDTVHSVTKSITSILFGIALDKGLITDLKAPLIDFFPQYLKTVDDPRKGEINLEHLLTMTAGLQQVRAKEWNQLLAWNFADDRIRHTLDLPMVDPPGKRFAYSNPLTHLLGIVLAQKSGLSLWEFAAKNLFGPLGIRPKLWKEDVQGFNVGGGSLYLSPRHMAKIGFLCLNMGRWDQQQIVSADWIETATRQQVKAGPDYGYGYLWWTRPVAGHHSYRAWGRNGQFIVVVPKLDLVVVVTSSTGMPGRSSEHYAPLFDIVAGAVMN